MSTDHRSDVISSSSDDGMDVPIKERGASRDFLELERAQFLGGRPKGYGIPRADDSPRKRSRSRPGQFESPSPQTPPKRSRGTESPSPFPQEKSVSLTEKTLVEHQQQKFVDTGHIIKADSQPPMIRRTVTMDSSVSTATGGSSLFSTQRSRSGLSTQCSGSFGRGESMADVMEVDAEGAGST